MPKLIAAATAAAVCAILIAVPAHAQDGGTSAAPVTGVTGPPAAGRPAVYQSVWRPRWGG